MIESSIALFLIYWVFAASILFFYRGANLVLHSTIPGVQLHFSTLPFILLVWIGLHLGLFTSIAMQGASCLFVGTLVLGISDFFVKMTQNKEKLRLPTIKIIDLTLLFFLGSIFWLWELRNLAFVPSEFDGINHLTFYHSLLKAGEFFTGKISLSYSEFFGRENFEFYPSGSHFLTAVITTPLRVLLKVSEFSQIKITLIFFLAMVMPIIYDSLQKTFPQLQRKTLWSCALLAFSVSIFPFNPLGEGGFSRIIAQIIILPLLFNLIKPERILIKITLVFIITPALFLNHPSSVLYLVVIALYWIVVFTSSVMNSYFGQIQSEASIFKKDSLKSSIIPTLVIVSAALYAVFILYQSLKTGYHIVEDTQLFSNQVLPWTFSEIYTKRMNGLVHYAFNDPYSVGKFFALRSLLIYFSFFLLTQKSLFSQRTDLRPLRILVPLACATPFLLSLLRFIPSHWAHLLGMLFYHDTRRLAEMNFFAFILAWCLALESIFVFFQSQTQKILLITLVVITSVGGLMRGHHFLERLYEIYQAPTITDIQDLNQRLEQSSIPEGTWISCQTQKAGMIHSLPKWEHLYHWLTFSGECPPNSRTTQHCENRRKRMQEIDTPPSHSLGWGDCSWK